MESEFTYPTLGEVVKYLFDATGVLARKGDYGRANNFGEPQKRSVQKKLERLAKEEYALQPQLDDLVKTSSELLSEVIRCPIAAKQVSELINDLYERYRELITEQGTYMSKTDTVRFFLTNYGVDIAVRSLARDWLKWQPINPTAARPDQEFWFLPADKGDGWTWPLSHALKWAYRVCGVSQAQFHQPSNYDDPRDQLERNLKSANSWTRGATIPSMFVLVKNLDESFIARADIGKPVDAKVRNDIMTVAALGRIATVIARDIERVYGTSFLRETITQIKQYIVWMRIETSEFQLQFEEESAKLRGSATELLELRFKMFLHFMAFFDAKRNHARDLMEEHKYTSGTLRTEVIHYLEKHYGAYAARVPIDTHSRWQLDKPERFEELVSHGLGMMNKVSTQDVVDRFAADMQTTGVGKRAPWLVHWLRGAVYYRSEDYAGALLHYKQAYELAKYSAGAFQYRLVNQYLEITAKTDSWRDFKKAALWACYLGVPIRWLRQHEPNDENLREVFKILGMKSLQYARL